MIEDEVESDELEEFPEATIEIRAIPHRIMLCFSGAQPENTDQLDDIISEVVEEAESRGLFLEFGMSSEMGLDDVIEGSPLYELVTGRANRK